MQQGALVSHYHETLRLLSAGGLDVAVLESLFEGIVSCLEGYSSGNPFVNVLMGDVLKASPLAWANDAGSCIVGIIKGDPSIAKWIEFRNYSYLNSVESIEMQPFFTYPMSYESCVEEISRFAVCRLQVSASDESRMKQLADGCGFKDEAKAH